jgi:hypothetical protein
MSQFDSAPELQQALAAQTPEPTELSRLSEHLSPPQQAALGALAGGQTLSSAATTAGVSRMTIWRWLKTDPAFAEAYRQWKLELRESSEAGLLRASEKAVAAVAKAAADGDARIALLMLREMGLLRSAGTCADPGEQPIE